MIAKAEELSKNFGSTAKFETLDFLRMKDKFKDEFDLVICLGNTLPHLFKRKRPLLSLMKFPQLTEKTAGCNSSNFKLRQNHPERGKNHNIRDTKDKIFIRFYDLNRLLSAHRV
jgi:hypothetical protein